MSQHLNHHLIFRKFEQDYLSYLKSSGLGILEEIAEKKAISDDLTNKMKSALYFLLQSYMPLLIHLS